MSDNARNSKGVGILPQVLARQELICRMREGLISTKEVAEGPS